MEQKVWEKVIKYNYVGCRYWHKNSSNYWCWSKPFSIENFEDWSHNIYKKNEVLNTIALAVRIKALKFDKTNKFKAVDL